MVRQEETDQRAPLRAEIVSVGTELLLGTIVDTNAAYLAQRLADLGIDCFHISASGDNLGRLAETLQRAFHRSTLVVCTGGLGPTGDDLTREAVARVLGEEPYVVPELEADLRAFFARRGVDMPQRNLKQATLIPSARAIPNPVGTAPGWLVETNVNGASRTGIFMPGVPFEMKRMWEREVEPVLKGRSGMVLVSRTLKTMGAGESAVEEKVADLMEGSNPTLAPYAKADGIHLRISAKADRPDRAVEMIDVLEMRVRERLGDLVYGVNEDTPQSAVASLATKLGISYALIEVGSAVAGALVRGLGSAGGFRAGLAAQSTTELAPVLSIDKLSSVPQFATAFAERTGADIVAVVVSDTGDVGQNDSVVRANVEALIIDANGAVLLAQKQSWQIPAGEVPRVAGLMAVNLLRRSLLRLQGEKESVGAN